MDTLRLAGYTFLALAALAMALISPVHAQDPGLIVDGQLKLTVEWIAPTKYENGTDILAGDLTGYVIYWGTESRFLADGSLRAGCMAVPQNGPVETTCYPNVLDLTDGTALSQAITLSANQDVTFHFAMTAYTANGLWSAYSDEVPASFVMVLSSFPGRPVIQSIQLEMSCTTNNELLRCEFKTVE